MKKIIFILLSLLMLSAMAVGINAGTDYIIPNSPVTVEISTPTVDGNITKTEGWSEAVYMNEDTLSYLIKDKPLTIWAEVYFAVDRGGFYFAANVIEGQSSFKPDYEYDISDLSSNIAFSAVTSEGEYKDNGDLFCLGIDPLGFILDNGYVADSHFAPVYKVAFYEDGRFRMFRNSDEPNITDQVILEGNVTDDGWRFEAWIPWNLIIEDVSYHTFNNHMPLTHDEIVKNGSLIRVGATYVDRYIDTDGRINRYNSYNTSPEYYRDGGTPGYNFKDVEHVEALGIELLISDTCRGNGHRWSDWVVKIRPTFIDEGEEYSVCRLCGEYRYRTVPVVEYVNVYPDVKDASWYAEAVEYCVKHNYMGGMGNNHFSPNTALTREQCVVMLANIMRVNTRAYREVPSGFDDVPLNNWYSGAVAWAVEMGYVKGMSENTFGTGQKIQRAAFARLIYLVARDLGADMKVRADLTEYADHDKLPEWAYEQISWAVGN
ncbi:MAG: S-layer homology domain-containing protein, partial [Clostridia bacterium]|nr:S-layer homology domain-containing protein [Clostridia bacterium]